MQAERKVGPIRHAPWSRRFRTFYCNGWYAHELQIGPVVIYVRHGKPTGGLRHKVTIRKDAYWR